MRENTLRVGHAPDSQGQTAALEVSEVQTANALGCSSIDGLGRSKSGAEGSSPPSESCGLHMNPRRNRKRKARMFGRGRAALSDVGPVEVGEGYMIVLDKLDRVQRRLAKRHVKQARRDSRAMSLQFFPKGYRIPQVLIEHHGLDVYLPRHTRKTP